MRHYGNGYAIAVYYNKDISFSLIYSYYMIWLMMCYNMYDINDIAYFF